MRVWPVILDSQPEYLGGGTSGSLLLAPLGSQLLIEHLRQWLQRLTGNAPLVVSPGSASPEYDDRIVAACPAATVVTTSAELVDILARHEMSDGLLIIDPQCLPMQPDEFSTLLRSYEDDPRVSHHLVAFEGAVAGTKERVSFDSRGRVRRILRHYEPATWPFISGVTATLLPVASGVLTDGTIPRSLVNLRQILASRGVPARDVVVDGGVFDLAREAGMLAATEHLVRQATAKNRPAGAPLLVGGGQVIHATARVNGPVVIHPDVQIEAEAMVFGPAVIGRGARIGRGAIVAHAVIGPRATVAGEATVRNRVWPETAAAGATPADSEAVSYHEGMLLRALEAGRRSQPSYTASTDPSRARHLPKRVLDVAVTGLLLAIFSPLLLLAVIAVWLESKGPIFYGDEREGVGGRVFRCWKFRTMCTGAHAAQMNLKTLDKMDGPHFKLDYDPRVTRVGRVLRALNIDELPQLFNVLVGEMSLVGPRPSPFRENQVCVPWREARLSVQPGITGFWQVCRHDRSAGDFHQWIEYDLLYVQHRSFWLDIKILASTFITLGGKVGYIPAKWLVASASDERSSGSVARNLGRADSVDVVPT